MNCTCNQSFVLNTWQHHPSCKELMVPIPSREADAKEKLKLQFAKGYRQADSLIGIGGGPTRATTLPEDSTERKAYPVASGVLDYFPDAIAAVSHLSWKGNEQHNPGQSLHWARGKSADEADTLMRHFLQRGTLDSDGIRHSVKVAWRALALLQKEIEEAQNGPQ